MLILDFVSLLFAAMAAKANMPYSPHSSNLTMVTVFTLPMLCEIPNAGPHVRFSIELTNWIKDFYYPELQVRDGLVAIPDVPGWDVTINPKWLSAAKRQISDR